MSRTKERLITPSEVAAIHQCAKVSVMAAIERGALVARPVYGPGGKISTWAISEDAARAWSPDPERQARRK